MRRTRSGGGDFIERVMAAIARESTPTPARTLLSAIRRRSPRAAASTLWVAWHLGTVRSWPVAPGVRARSIALVLAVACALGTGSLAAAAALRVVAEPVVELFQSGVDEQGPVTNGPSGVDQPQPADDQSGPGQSGDGQSDKDEDAADDQSGPGQSGVDETADDDQPGSDQPGGEPPGGSETIDNDQPGAEDASGDGDPENDGSGADEPGAGDSDEDGQSGA